ncbi:MAG: flagellar hook-length control protein FliK [Deltaproteobacteria bacterium]|nr:flagellar hook-length control protein FliK [Deltaproteobacteria bacterium]TLN04832.1 MAG: flagellar hook-length control protein FliK [bacterium]
MDAAQMITSAVVPGAAVLPASAEFSSGTSAASPLFREMFSKATLAAGVALEQQSAGENVPAAEQRGLTLHNGRESKGEVKADLSEGANQENLRETSVEDAGNAIFGMLPAGLVSVPVTMPVVRNISHGYEAEMHGASKMPVLPGTAAAVAQAVTGSVRGTFFAVPVTANAAETVENQLASLDQSETRRIRSFPDAGTGLRPLTVEAADMAKTAGQEVSAASPAQKETAEAVPVGEKLFGKDHVNLVRHENSIAMKQAQYEQKPAGKGETVIRELPSGVTVLNPAQTLTMGRPAITAEAAPLAVQGTERGRIFPQEGEAREEMARQISPTGEAEKIARNVEGFSSQNNSNFGHDSTSNGGNHGLPQTAAASGAFDAVAKGQLEPLSEVPREHEVSELHQNILSQVREKLVSQDPSGTVSKISLKLNPHELGELQINVRLEDQKMRVDITAQNPVVKEALLQNIEQLKDSLMRQNISMERFHVSTSDGGQAFNQSFREGRQSAQHTPDTFTYPLSGYYQEDPQVSQAAYADVRENSLVDMRF